MYKSEYLTVRVMDPTDAVEYEPVETVDKMLWLLDVYDLKAGCFKGAHRFFLSNYHALHSRIPGCIPRWSKSMLAWVVLLQHLEPDFQHDKQWACDRGIYVGDPVSFTVTQLITALDVLSMRWHLASRWDQTRLRKYLHSLWSSARKWTLHMHPTMDRGEKQGEHWKMNPVDVVACMSRYYWFHQTLEQLTWFDVNLVPPEPNFWSAWITREERHLVVRKFRDTLSTAVWANRLHYGDMEIASHKQLGEGMSAYAALYKRQPVCLLQEVQQAVSYGDMTALQPHLETVQMHMIRTYFQNNHQMDFVKFFVCMERDAWKHRDALMGSMVPILLQQFGSFALLHDGVIRARGPLSVVFPEWVRVARKPHGIDLEHLHSQLFTPPEETTAQKFELPL